MQTAKPSVVMLVALCVCLAGSKPDLAVMAQGQSARLDVFGDPLPQGAIARVGTIRWRHDGEITFAAFLPDGKNVISIANDSTIRIWDFPSGKEIRRISLQAESAKAKPLALEIVLRPLVFEAAALSPDGKIIATCFGSDKEILLHEVATGKTLHSITAGSRTEKVLVFSPDSKTLMALGSDGAFNGWDVATGKVIGSIETLQSSRFGMAKDSLVTAPNVVCAPDGKSLMYFDGGNALRFVNAETGRGFERNLCHTAPILSVMFTTDGNDLLTADRAERPLENARWETGTGKFLGLEKRKIATDLMQRPLLLLNEAMSPDGKFKAGLSPTALAGAAPFPFLELPKLGQPLSLSLLIVNAETGKEVGKAELEKSVLPPSIQFSPGGTMVAAIGDGTGFELYEVPTAKRLHKVTIDQPDSKDVNDPRAALKALSARTAKPTLVFSPDSKAVAANIGAKTRIWDTGNGNLIGSFYFPPKANTFPTFTPDGRCLAFDVAGTVSLVELATGKVRRNYGNEPKALGLSDTTLRIGGVVGRRAPLRPLFVDGGRSLVHCGPDRMIYAWDITSGKELAAFKGHTGDITAIAVSRDSKLLASASMDTTALIWDLAALPRPAALAKPLGAPEIQAAWQTLTESDAAKSFIAMLDMAAAGKGAVDFIAERLKPAPPVDAVAIRGLISNLSDKQLKVREKAMNELLALGDWMIPLVEEALAAKPPLETKIRLEGLLAKTGSLMLQGYQLQAFRAIEVLEMVGTPAAKDVLKSLAGGDPRARLTSSAQAALTRIEKQGENR